MNDVKTKIRVTCARDCTNLSNVSVQITPLDNISEVIYNETTDQDGVWDHKNYFFKAGSVVTFSKFGYCEKEYHGVDELPPVVRLIRKSVVGYQNKVSFRAGEKVEVYVHSFYGYTAQLYRHGLRKELIQQLGSFNKSLQRCPDGFFCDKGMGWEKKFSYELSIDLKPGLYSVLLKDHYGNIHAIPMTISNRNYYQEKSLLVLGNVNTWLAYNSWGGRSRYRNYESPQNQVVGNVKKIQKRSLIGRIKRVVKVFLPVILEIAAMINRQRALPDWCYEELSIHRPFNCCELSDKKYSDSFTNHLARAEWVFLSWLEHENINYDFASDYELEANVSIIEKYSSICLSTHSEYWTSTLFDAVSDNVKNKGMWLVNLSGNTMYGHIQILGNDCIQLIHEKLSKSHRDESLLTGVRYTPVGFGTASSYRTCIEGHPFLTVANLSKDEEFGMVSMNGNKQRSAMVIDPGNLLSQENLVGTGASGWETDKRTLTSRWFFKLLAKGTNPDNGGAEMVYRAPKDKRGGVFSAGSITFASGLFSDKKLSKIVKNVLTFSYSSNS